MFNMIYIGSDHAGFDLKKKIVEHLGNKVLDMGPHELNTEDDYPDYIKPVVQKVVEDGSVGIIIGGSGQGEAIVANRFKEARAIVYNCNNLDLIKLGREHNNANILSIGARFVSDEDAIKAVDMFLDLKFPEDERHVRRIKKIDL